MYGVNRSAYKVLVGKPERRRPFARLRRRWEDDIKINFKERGWEGMAWTDVS